MWDTNMLSFSLCRSSVANEKHLDEEDIGGKTELEDIAHCGSK